MNKVPFVNYPLQYRNLEKEIDEAIKDVLNRGDLILRKDVEEFEKNVSSFLGAQYGVGVNSCTDAMILSLYAAGVKKGDEVITVAHTFFATIEAIFRVGGKPVLVDVKEEDFLMDVDKVEELITEKTKAIIPVHLNGRVCNMERLKEISQKHSLIIIEDAAQAIGAEFDGKRAGSFGLTGCFSFYPAKTLGCFGDGGLLVTDDEKLAEKAKILRDHGQRTRTDIIDYAWNSRLDNLQAAILNVKFKYLPELIKRRREIAEIYNKGLADILGLKLPLPPLTDSRNFDSFQNYVLKAEKRDELYEFLKENGVETLIKDPIPLHYHQALNLSHFKLPVTEKLAKEVISLPMYPELTNEQVEYVINCLLEFYKK